MYNKLINKYLEAKYETDHLINLNDVKRFWTGYFEKSVTFRTKSMSDKLVDDLIFFLSLVPDRIAVNFVQQYRPQVELIISQLKAAKKGLRDITSRQTYQSSEKLFANCYNKWLVLSKQLSEKNPVFGNVYVSICDRKTINDVTQSFRLYSNYSDRYR